MRKSTPIFGGAFGNHLDERAKELLPQSKTPDSEVFQSNPEKKPEKADKPSKEGQEKKEKWWKNSLNAGRLWLSSPIGPGHTVIAIIITLFCFWLLRYESPVWFKMVASREWFAVFLIFLIPVMMKFPRFAGFLFGLSILYLLIDSKVDIAEKIRNRYAAHPEPAKILWSNITIIKDHEIALQAHPLKKPCVHNIKDSEGTRVLVRLHGGTARYILADGSTTKEIVLRDGVSEELLQSPNWSGAVEWVGMQSLNGKEVTVITTEIPENP